MLVLCIESVLLVLQNRQTCLEFCKYPKPHVYNSVYYVSVCIFIMAITSLFHFFFSAYINLLPSMHYGVLITQVMLFIPLWAYFWSHCQFATVVHGFPLGKTSTGHFRTLFVQMGDSFVVKGWDIYFAAVNSNKYANLLFNPIFPPPYLSFCEFLVRKQLEKLMIDFSCVGAGWGKAKRIT